MRNDNIIHEYINPNAKMCFCFSNISIILRVCLENETAAVLTKIIIIAFSVCRDAFTIPTPSAQKDLIGRHAGPGIVESVLQREQRRWPLAKESAWTVLNIIIIASGNTLSWCIKIAIHLRSLNMCNVLLNANQLQGRLWILRGGEMLCKVIFKTWNSTQMKGSELTS